MKPYDTFAVISGAALVAYCAVFVALVLGGAL